MVACISWPMELRSMLFEVLAKNPQIEIWSDVSRG